MPYKDPVRQKEAQLRAHRAWRARNPGHRSPATLKDYGQRRTKAASRAYAKVYRAVKSGTLVRPSECSKCQKSCKPEASHADYANPLDVRWLCVNCHRQEDKLDPKGGRV